MTEWKLPAALPSLAGAPLISLDIETRDPNIKEQGPGVRRDGYVVGIAVGVPNGGRWYIPFRHEEGPQFDPEQVRQWARVELCRPDQPKLGANILYDLDYLYHWGVPVTGPFYDVQNAEPLLDENRGHYNLDSLSEAYLQEGKDETLLEQACEARGLKGTPQSHIWLLPPKYVGPYAEADVDRPLRLFPLQKKRLNEEGLWDLFMLETQLVPLLLAMRQRGVRIDVEKTRETRRLIWEKIQVAKKAIREVAGQEVNVWANESIALAFEKLGIEYKRTKKTEAPSFQGWWLEKQEHPIGKLILEERKLDKFLGTFIDGHVLSNLVGERVHCQFNQLRGDDFGTVTGRMSCQSPNLQQIPARDPVLGPICRSLFIPEPGELWGRSDFKQIELRILAHYGLGNGAEEMRQAYITDPNVDFHQQCADMAGLERKMMKSVTFGIIYGMGVKKLCNQLGLDEIEGKAFLNMYHAKLPFVKETTNTAARTADRRGYVHTILGRRRRFTEFEPADFNLSFKFRDTGCPKDAASVHTWIREQIAAAEGRAPRPGIKRAYTYRALNAIIQGSAADLLKQAMVDIWKSGVCAILGPPLLTVHDELDFSVPDTKEGKEAFAEACRLMEQAVKFKVPVLVDSELKLNWGADLQ